MSRSYAVAKHPVADCQRKCCVEVVARREAGTRTLPQNRLSIKDCLIFSTASPLRGPLNLGVVAELRAEYSFW